MMAKSPSLAKASFLFPLRLRPASRAQVDRFDPVKKCKLNIETKVDSCRSSTQTSTF